MPPGKGSSTPNRISDAAIQQIVQHLEREGLQHAAGVVLLSAYFGTRVEEAALAGLTDWRKALEQHRSVFIERGAMGGRKGQRWVAPSCEFAEEILQKVISYRPKRSICLIPPDMSLASFKIKHRQKVGEILQAHGVKSYNSFRDEWLFRRAEQLAESALWPWLFRIPSWGHVTDDVKLTYLLILHSDTTQPSKEDQKLNVADVREVGRILLERAPKMPSGARFSTQMPAGSLTAPKSTEAIARDIAAYSSQSDVNAQPLLGMMPGMVVGHHPLGITLTITGRLSAVSDYFLRLTRVFGHFPPRKSAVYPEPSDHRFPAVVQFCPHSDDRKRISKVLGMPILDRAESFLVAVEYLDAT